MDAITESVTTLTADLDSRYPVGTDLESAETPLPPAPPPSVASMQEEVKPVIYQILPEMFRFNLPPDDHMPTLKDVRLPDIYPVLGLALGGPDYDVNLATFWFLDIIAEAMLVAQCEKNMSEKNQRVLLGWFGHMFKLIQEHSWSREETFAHLSQNILESGAEMLLTKWNLVTPDQIGQLRPVSPLDEHKPASPTSLKDVHGSEVALNNSGTSRPAARKGSKPRSPPTNKKSKLRGQSSPTLLEGQEVAPAIDASLPVNLDNPGTSRPSTRKGSKSTPRSPPTNKKSKLRGQSSPTHLEGQEVAPAIDASLPVNLDNPEVAIQDMITIIELVYGAFANSFTHKLVRAAFCNPLTRIDFTLPNEIHMPKKLKPPPPPPPKEKKKKGDKKDKSDKSKKGSKGSKSSKDDKSTKSSKSGKGKKEKSEKGGGSEKTGKTSKSSKGNGKKGKDGASSKSGKKGKGKKGKQVEVIEPVIEEKPKELYQTFPLETLAEVAATNKKYIVPLQEGTCKEFFEEIFPRKVEEESVEGKGKKGKKDKKGKSDKKSKGDKKGKSDKKSDKSKSTKGKKKK